MKIDYANVKVNDGFWKQKQDLNRNITIHSVWNRFYDTGRIDAFKCEWKEGDEHKPHIFWDSDGAKWIEAASYMIGKESSKDLEEKIEWLIDCIEKNQQEDGYFNIFYTVCEPNNRFTVRRNHELYCAGHLIEAAVAYYEATGKDRFLKLMMKYADYIEKVFVVDQSSSFVTCGHEEIELALVKLYRCTQLEKYLKLAEFFIDNRGINNEIVGAEFLDVYAQDHLPVRSQNTAEGHAVRAFYLYSAMADLAKETSDDKLLSACQKIFNDVISKKMYITGGTGSSHLGEAFTIPFDLPNEIAYNETCSAIALVFFAQRMLAIDTKSIYADVIERALYNGVLSGLSIDGKAFFYENPLEITLKNHTKNVATSKKERYPITQRKEVFNCSCCPPNLSRLLASLGETIYGFNDDTFYIHQFIDSEMDYNGAFIKQTTQYPTNGNAQISTKNVNKLMIRIPSWCEKFDLGAEYEMVDGYACVNYPTETIKVHFEMKPVLMHSSANVWHNVGKVALQYGPIVHCLESVDNGENLHALYIDKNLKAEIKYDAFFDLNIIKTPGFRKIPSSELYSKVEENFEETTLKFVPYYGFANRGESDMLVWMNYR